MAEPIIAAAIRRDAECLTSITWEHLSAETKKDPDMSTLLEIIRHGFPDDSRQLPHTVALYWQYRHGLYESDGVIVYDDRVVVPPSLRPTVLETLHSAHQGVSGMSIRARSIIFWPGMTNDIDCVRARCNDCNRNVPTQAPLSTSSMPPSTPFEKVFADFFDCGGRHYLVIGDRLSGWCDVFQSPHGSPQAGAEGLITCLRNYFSRLGVPIELSSDGGPEFVAKATEIFLHHWGVSH